MIMSDIKYKYEISTSDPDYGDDYRCCDVCNSFAPLRLFEQYDSSGRWLCQICAETEIPAIHAPLHSQMARAIAQTANITIDIVTDRRKKAGVENASY
jgi:hypothetical protein